MPDALLMQNYVKLSLFKINLLLHFELFVAYTDNTWIVQHIVKHNCLINYRLTLVWIELRSTMAGSHYLMPNKELVAFVLTKH
jgi:hypothetical protein